VPMLGIKQADAEERMALTESKKNLRKLGS
jgi:hypothetical protein